ncbi:MAG TPA: ABC transporter substrate-binding protein [Chloroflexota bacterium]|jgi:NitT/TauT family transport system substrate-binding protein|nr:ABC transporter substrate-binding protein [Chloroflexota bacterium]
MRRAGAVLGAILIALVGWGSACGPRAAAPAGGSSAATPPASGSPTASAAAPAGAPAQPPPLETVRMGCIAGTSDAGLYIAEEKGYFREWGIRLDCTNFASATEMVAPLGTGQLDVAGGAPSAGLGNALARGITLKIVADKGSTPPGFGYAGLVVRKDLWDSGAVRGPADFRGRRLAINTTAGSSMEASLDRLFREHGLQVADVELVSLPFGDQPGALANGSVDVAFPIEPFVTISAEQGLGVLWERQDTWYPTGQIAVLMYGRNFAESRIEVGRRFMVAYLKAVRDYNDAFRKGDAAKRREVVDILIRNTPLKDAALYDKMGMPGLDPNGRVSVQALKADQEYYLRSGKQQQPIDYDQVVDMSFADWAVQQLGEYR